MECLNCGAKVSGYENQKWFCNPTKMIVATSYFLCDEHKNLEYRFEDVYEIKDDIPKRKNIDHDSVSKRME